MQCLNLKQTLQSYARSKLEGEAASSWEVFSFADPCDLPFLPEPDLEAAPSACLSPLSSFSPLICAPFLLSPGDMHAGGGFLALLLPLLFLLGADRGLAVLHGRDGSVTEPHHPQALLVSRMGWGLWVCIEVPLGQGREKKTKNKQHCSILAWRSKSILNWCCAKSLVWHP